MNQPWTLGRIVALTLGVTAFLVFYFFLPQMLAPISWVMGLSTGP